MKMDFLKQEYKLNMFVNYNSELPLSNHPPWNINMLVLEPVIVAQDEQLFKLDVRESVSFWGED